MVPLLYLAVFAESQSVQEATSFLGKPLMRPTLAAEASQRLNADLSAAIADFEKSPTEDNVVWVGRRLAYLGRFRDSIDWYTKQLERFTDSAKLLRHRGHRYITTRQIDKAIADFERAATLIKGTKDEIEPDGVPNAKNTPLTSLHSNVWYHLALARFLNGDYAQALVACDEGMRLSNNPDRLVSQTYWRYLILRRLDRDEEAKEALNVINKDLDLIENHAYLRLLLVYKGDLSLESAVEDSSGDVENPTVAFGLGAFLLANGEIAKAKEFFMRATSSGSWAAFGFIAAEAELARMGRD